jgi:hypothetical protein
MSMAIPTDLTMITLNRPYVFKGCFPLGFIDQFIRKLPFQYLDQPTTNVFWNQISGSLTAAPYNADANLPATPLNTTQKIILLQRIGDSVLVDQQSQTASGNTNDLLQTEIQAKRVAIVRSLGYQAILGDANSPNLNGLISESPSTITVSGTGVPTVNDLHRLVHMVRASDGAVGGGADCIVTHERVVRYLLSLLNTSTALDFIFDPELGVPVPHFRGIPIYIGQVPDVGSYAFDIWALKISGPTGIRMLHATGSSDRFGIDVVPVPLQPFKAQIGAFVGGLYGLMIPEPQAFARLAGTTAAGLNTAGVAP